MNIEIMPKLNDDEKPSKADTVKNMIAAATCAASRGESIEENLRCQWPGISDWWISAIKELAAPAVAAYDLKFWNAQNVEDPDTPMGDILEDLWFERAKLGIEPPPQYCRTRLPLGCLEAEEER